MNHFPKTVIVVATLVFSGLLAGCGQSEELRNALAAAGQTAKRNQELEQKVGNLTQQLSSEKDKVSSLSSKLDQAERMAQAERDAKWRARNEVAGAQKVAKSATLAAHSVGVKQAVAKPGDRKR